MSYLSAIRKLFSRASKESIVVNDEGYMKLSMREIDSASSTRSVVPGLKVAENIPENTDEASARRDECARNSWPSEDLINKSPPAGGSNVKGPGRW